MTDRPLAGLRVAVVANTAWYLVNFRINLMRALQLAGAAVVAVAPEDDHAQVIRDAGIDFAPIKLSGAGRQPWSELRSVAMLWRTFRSHRIDLVLSYTPKGNLYSALACVIAERAFVPNVSGLGRTFIRRTWVTHLVSLMYRATFGRAQRVFFQNQDDLDTFVRAGLVPAALVERLPGSGVDLTRFLPVPLPENAPEAPLFVMIARMLWDKGVGEFVEAARVVQRSFPGARFVLLGFADVANPSAISRKQLDKWTAEGVVRYMGQTDDVRPWLAQADCVVLPSYREGLPRTLLEAGACARPVVTTNAPGCRDAVRDCVTGYLCRTADSDDLACKLMTFIGLPRLKRQEFGARAREFVEQNFDERRVIDRYLATAQEIRDLIN